MRKIVLLFSVVLLAFALFFIFDKSDSPTGNIILDNQGIEEVEAQESEEVIVKETSVLPERKNYVKGSITLNPYYVLYQNIRSNSEGKFVKVHYKITSDNQIEFLMFPTSRDMISYSELRNPNYDTYQCGGVGKKLEGDCLVDNVGFAIWNKDGGISSTIQYELKFSNIEIAPEKISISKRVQHS